MNNPTWTPRPLRSYSGYLAPLLAVAVLLFVFGSIAEDVREGEPFAFDRTILLALREPGNPAVPIGPPWLPEAARDDRRKANEIK